MELSTLSPLFVLHPRKKSLQLLAVQSKNVPDYNRIHYHANSQKNKCLSVCRDEPVKRMTDNHEEYQITTGIR